MKDELTASDAGNPDRAFLTRELALRREQVFLICLGYTRNPVEAEELAQDVFCRAWERAGSFQSAGHFGRWLVILTRNRCRDSFRTARLRRVLLGRNRPETLDRESPEDRLLRDETTLAVKRAVAGLSEKLRAVLVLREYGELSYQEIAETLGIDQGTVMSRLNRARRSVAAKTGLAPARKGT
jgi:RNA polymerase sigma-70 factor, ECF subfamily